MITLILKDQPPVPLEAEMISPDVMAPLAPRVPVIRKHVAPRDTDEDAFVALAFYNREVAELRFIRQHDQHSKTGLSALCVLCYHSAINILFRQI